MSVNLIWLSMGWYGLTAFLMADAIKGLFHIPFDVAGYLLDSVSSWLLTTSSGLPESPTSLATSCRSCSGSLGDFHLR